LPVPSSLRSSAAAELARWASFDVMDIGQEEKWE
jgi:hypothetical protein